MKIVRFKVQSVRYKNSFVFFALLTYGFLIRNSGLLNIKSIIFYNRIIFPLSRIGNIFLSVFIEKNLMIHAVYD
jgi:hypothetical protein